MSDPSFQAAKTPRDFTLGVAPEQTFVCHDRRHGVPRFDRNDRTFNAGQFVVRLDA
jgi:hypothetical protein